MGTYRPNVYLRLDQGAAIDAGGRPGAWGRPPSSRHFDLKAVLMWTMHDFPGYSDCSGKNSNNLPTLILLAILIITIDFIILTFYFILTGLRTSGKHACPICGPSLVHEYVDGLCKTIFDNHHWFLLSDHPKYAAIKRHASGYVTIDSTKFWQTKKDRLVLPQQCEQVCFFLQMCFMYIYI